MPGRLEEIVKTNTSHGREIDFKLAQEQILKRRLPPKVPHGLVDYLLRA